MAFTVLLDACVLVPYPLFDVLLRLADAETYRPLWSATILTEVERACVQKLQQDPARVAARIEAMTATFPEAEVTGYEQLVGSMTNHPKDRHVLAAAVVANASLLDLRDLYPEATWAAIYAMLAASARPPKSPGELAKFLEPTAPLFAAKVGRELS